MKVELPFSSEVKSQKSGKIYELFLRFGENVVFTAGADFAAFGSFIAFTNMIYSQSASLALILTKHFGNLFLRRTGVNHSLGVDWTGRFIHLALALCIGTRMWKHYFLLKRIWIDRAFIAEICDLIRYRKYEMFFLIDSSFVLFGAFLGFQSAV